MSKPIKGKGMETLRLHPLKRTLSRGATPATLRGRDPSYYIATEPDYDNPEGSSIPVYTKASHSKSKRKYLNPVGTQHTELDKLKGTVLAQNRYNRSTSNGRKTEGRLNSNFWGEVDEFGRGDAIADLMSNNQPSAVEYNELSSQVAPETVFAQKVRAGGSRAAKNFAKELSYELQNKGAVPADKSLVAKLRAGRFKPEKVLRDLVGGEGYWEGAVDGGKIDEYDEDRDFSGINTLGTIDYEYGKTSDQSQRALSLKNHNLAKAAAQGYVDVTSKLSNAFDVRNKFTTPLYNFHNLTKTIAEGYLDPTTFPRGLDDPKYNKAVGLIQRKVQLHLETSLPNIRKAMADMTEETDPAKRVYYTDAIPSKYDVIRGVRGVGRHVIQGNYDLKWTEDKSGKRSSMITESLKQLSGILGDEDRGIARKANLGWRESSYIRDELAASGVDPASSVFSQDASRDTFSEFGMVSEPSQMLDAAMRQTGATTADLKDPVMLAAVRGLAGNIAEGVSPMYSTEESARALAQDLADAQDRSQLKANSAFNDSEGKRHAARTRITHSTEGLYTKEALAARAYAEKQRQYSGIFSDVNMSIAYGGWATVDAKGGRRKGNASRDEQERMYNSLFTDENILSVYGAIHQGAQSHAKRKSRIVLQRGTAIPSWTQDSAPKTLQEAIEKVQAEQAAKVDPLEAYLAAHPNMRHIAHDDDKDDPMSLWMRIRRNKQTSSSINETTDPATRDTSFRDGLLKAMTPLDTPATIDLGNRAIEGGNNIEPEILSHLKSKDKRFEGLFSPGMLENIDLPGHATTPDAIINGGATNVEIKTRKDKFYNPNKEIRNKYDEQERVTYQKNWEQMQHQMYVTGARNTKLVEVIRDSNDPSQPMGRKGFIEGENYKVTDIPFDEKYVNRNKERWDREALAKQEFSKLDQGTQEAFKEILKAGVREGMGDAFEDLAKKNKISNADALRESLSKADIIPPPKEPKAKQANNAAAGSGGKQSKNNGGVSGGSGGSGNGGGGGGGNNGTSVGAHNPAAGKGTGVGKPRPFSNINGYSLDDQDEQSSPRRKESKDTKYLGFGLQGSASTWYGGVRQALDNGARKAESVGTPVLKGTSRFMYGINAAMALSQVAYDAMKSANDKTVENSMNARSVGMTRDMYNANLATMKKGGYANEAAAANDIKHVALAVGGLGTGHVDRAVQLVEATRGAINFSDLKDIDRKDPNAINALIEKGFGELKQRGIEGWEASAIMEQSGLMTMQRDIDATEGQLQLNKTLANIDTSLTEFAAKAATAMGDTVAGPLDDVHTALKDGFKDANGYLKNMSESFDSVKSFFGIKEETNELSPLQPEPTFLERFQGPNSQAIRNLDVNSGRQSGTEFADFVRDAEAAGVKIGNFFDKLFQLKGSEYQGAQDGGNTNITVKVEDHRVLIEDSNGVRATASLPINHTEY